MIMKINNLNYIYNPNTPFEKKALDNISLEIDEGEFIGLIGHTGSGKSTFVQHLNGLIKPTSGNIIIDNINIVTKDANLKEVRQKVGLVFQYPEHQLFEENIYKDIAFGPRNLGLNEEEIHSRVKESMELVGLNFHELKDRSPFELSGGQKRRVAIAGVIAMKPKILVLDEPTAGLDPRGRDEILGEIQKLYQKGGITIILVSHSMEDVAKLVDRILVMHKGKLQMDGSTREIFRKAEELESLGLGIPQITKFMKKFKEKGNDVKDDVLTVDEAKEEILKFLRRKEDA
ncbi:energy-coupling factor transport system ATP-binding protein [Tissierella praeacuta DSM 18095]|uniref:Energy-coupling factor transporter ATP-binding protein EcfA2 n=1 Tax=Tissierella praeacuta DSM 18095 TaxID=1123404 RepID=A0A1M4YAT6_9FIRM|nr:energy-coupling factor transporter ATPase [Tissierella praeacuta]TCU69679.1 energy-coupling factor transport system ATP-binding protein [Tissierella praeacuta]SHF02759.1 energy-coupling factor transport system ATP-binding protein [Tissierella praeacuta DSM 18095]SUP03243.1 Energy-coupling factor transporter ATP-binding protein EcfA2 [Tissierella praeacuta]